MSDPKKIMQGLSTRTKIYNFIRDYWAHEKMPPSIREIVDGCEISSTSIVAYHLAILQEQGIVNIQSRSNRTIVLVGTSIILPEYDERYA